MNPCLFSFLLPTRRDDLLQTRLRLIDSVINLSWGNISHHLQRAIFHVKEKQSGW